jgi:5-methylcytosine-specific restriction enzyme A
MRICAYKNCNNEVTGRVDKVFCCTNHKKYHKRSNGPPVSEIQKATKRAYDKEYHYRYYKAKPELSKSCIICSTQFKTSYSFKNTCSKECSHQLKLKSGRDYHFYKDGKGVVKACKCEKCGAQFKSNHKRKYCSIECRPNYHPPFIDKVERICEGCTQPYMPKYDKQRFCSCSCRGSGYGKFGGNQGFYNSKQWRQIRAFFITSHTVVDGLPISNKYCIECYKKHNRLNDMYAVDHIVRVKDGGSNEYNNLQSLCRHHHQSKSAQEGNKTRVYEAK